jgi:UDP-glucose 4-epimerase
MSRTFARPLVLGGGGFLGSWLLAALRAEGLVPSVVERSVTSPRSPADSVDLVLGDVLSVDLVSIMASRGTDVVFHLATAAYVPPSVDDPITDLRQNVETTVAVLEAARRTDPCPLVVLASSAAVYGEAVLLPMSEGHPLLPVSPYGVSKLTAERYLALYARLHGVPCIAVRMFSLYGPGQRKQVVYDLMCRALNGENPLSVLGRPNATRDLVYVTDAARGFIQLAQHAPATGEAYNLAAGHPTAIDELANAIIRILGLDVPVVFSGEVRRGDPLHWHGDASAAEALGVVFATELEQGLLYTAEWVRNNRA